MASPTSTWFLFQFTNSNGEEVSTPTQSHPMSFDTKLQAFEGDKSEWLWSPKTYIWSFKDLIEMLRFFQS